MALLFKRFWRVTVDTIATEAMDVEFRILRSTKPAPNRATVTLWNLNPSHRAELYQRNRPNGPKGATVPIPVKVEAGYVEQHSVLLYADMRELVTVQSGPTDWKTTLAVDDGGVAVREARFDKGGVTFPKGTPVGSVLREVCRAMGIGLGNVEDFTATAQILGVKMTALPGRMTFEGSAFDAMKRLSSTLGVKFSIQGGVLQMQATGKPLNVAAVRLTPTTGLIGSPEAAIDSSVSLGFAKAAKGAEPKQTTQVKRSNTAILKARSLLIPGLTPGRVVALESAAFNGNYQITDAEYTGQSFGQAWYVDMVLRAY